MIRRVLIAPDSFKGSLTAQAAAEAMALGLRHAGFTGEIIQQPLSDGGEGFMPALQSAIGGQLLAGVATDPLGRALGREPLPKWLWEPKQKVAGFELAEASGLTLLSAPERDPVRTSTHGFGQMIRAALRGVSPERVLIGIGGSATNDGGCGAAQALGVAFFDREGRRIERPIAGGDLSQIGRIDLSARLPLFEVVSPRVACDVDNPLTGTTGAAAVYGPQKGATPEQVEQLNQGLSHLAERFRVDCGVDVQSLPGAGAAGGFGAGAVAMLSAELVPGIRLLFEAMRFDAQLIDCDWCLTGEGRLDGQSLRGKVVGAVAEACARHGVPCFAVAGVLGEGWESLKPRGLQEAVEASQGRPITEAMRDASRLVAAASQHAFALANRSLPGRGLPGG